MLAELFIKFCYLWPFSKGRYRFFMLLSDEAKARLDGLPQPVSMKSGVKLFVRPGDHLSRWFRYFGEYEKSTSALLRDLATQDTVFVDVGANLGLHSLGVAKDIGCHVAAFEPSPETASRLVRSIEVNNLGDLVRPFRTALADEDGVATFVEPPAHVGQAALEAPTEGYREGGRYEVEVAALDRFEPFQDFLTETGKRVGLIKMDIEGAEERALRGMETLLREHKPTIVMELYDGNLNGFNSSRESVIAFLESVGYELDHEFEYNALFTPAKKSQSHHSDASKPASTAALATS